MIIALPVAAKDIVKLLKQEADLVEVVTSPGNFHAVGQYRQRFVSIGDAQVIEICKKAYLRTVCDSRYVNYYTIFFLLLLRPQPCYFSRSTEILFLTGVCLILIS